MANTKLALNTFSILVTSAALILPSLSSAATSAVSGSVSFRDQICENFFEMDVESSSTAALAAPLASTVDSAAEARARRRGTEPRVRQDLLREHRGFARLRSGREMYFSYREPSGEMPVMVVLHGLGNNMTDWDVHAEIWARKGYGVLRVDLHGFGKTRARFLESNPIPEVVDYMDSVEDVTDLIINRFHLKHAVPVGHSYGAAIARHVARRIQHDVEFAPIAEFPPYAVRLDSVQKDKLWTGEAYFDSLVQIFTAMGISETDARNWVAPFAEVTRRYVDTLIPFKDRVTIQAQVDAHLDPLAAPILDEFMRDYYPRYFVQRLGKDPSKLKNGLDDLTEAERAIVVEDVMFAIAVTKGIRAENVFSNRAEFSKKFRELLVIAGRDNLDSRELLIEYYHRLQELGIQVELVEVPNAGHLYPIEHPEESAHLVDNFVMAEWQRFLASRKMVKFH